MQEAFQDATKRSYGYLLCDLKPETPSDFQLHSIRGVSNGLIQFKGARKIWPLLELLAKIK